MRNNEQTIRRRTFLGGAVAAIASPYIVPASVPGKAAASERLTMGMIGLGSMGMRHVEGFLQEDDCRIVAVCDVDASRRRSAIEEINKHYGNTDCAQYNDFRELIGRSDIDTLCISVPDHWHGIIALEGVRAGKDIYGEKPLALTVAEGRVLVDEVNRYGCVWQTGSWQRSTAHFRFGCELVRNNRVGRLQKVEVGIGPGFKSPTEPTVDRIEPQPVQPVPQGFDYEMWLGPAPWAEYTEKRCHWNFRWILDYSGGQVTDWGAHHIDIAHWGMGCDETGPVEVAGTGIFPGDGLWDAAADYDFECKYADGLTMRVASNNHIPQGVRFIGEAGWVHITRAGLKTEPANLVKERIGPDEIHLSKPSGDNRQGHRRDFLDCVRTRSVTISPVEVGHRSAIPCHLGNIAMILGRPIRWDPKGEQVVGDGTANRMLSRPMRSPWRL
ncbi:MAG: Gfo/Idh/MocA family oxidoreductase [Sedimentisphaerales bacterium]|nr:Gfo/Idh/MocA family oxidoreductase [Sedimentisphaerales bacterium]